jgi:predicted transcriptional regulator
MYKENISLLINLSRIEGEIYNSFRVNRDQLKVIAGVYSYCDKQKAVYITKEDLKKVINYIFKDKAFANLFSNLNAAGFISVDKSDPFKPHKIRLTAKGQQVINHFNESAEKYARTLELQKVIYRKKIKPKTGRPAHPVICQGCIESFPPDQVRYIVNGFYCGECATEAGESGE